MIRVRGSVAAFTLMLLAGCSGGGADATVHYDSAAQLADAIGCKHFMENTTEELFTLEGGDCTIYGENINVYTFTNNDARDSYIKVGEQFGTRYLVGDGWVIEGSGSALATIQRKVGGAL